ncbi:chromate transporter [Leptospira alstonii]|uniref:Chromate transport protein n=2 Tax=Leptospira alstonii TaxID=28452 RepID=M6DDA5_9LEPT|nr:chromate transporter [Leptospira alstonii]EMJ96490.1 chromate transport protein [Leptospira alstonii serovar Sichuan str. 79601]EQA79040.1 chromate transport protein [Leptospira alstonii serovar Pingchang str. 80-412]
MIPSFGEALRFWFQLGWLSFGGPAGQISLMHKALVEEKKWISEDRFAHALNYCMILPGPEAQQLATYLGWILHGTKGGILAGLLFILPSVLIFIGISTFYFSYGSVPYAVSFLNGVKPAILAIILLAFGNLVLKSLKSNGQILCWILATIGILFFEVSYPILLLCSAFLGVVAFYNVKRNSDENVDFTEPAHKTTQNEQGRPSQNFKQRTFIFKNENIQNTDNSYERMDLQTVFDEKRIRTSEILKNLSRVGSIGLILWVLPFLGILFLLKSEFLFWKEMIVFFTRTALITFGGAYAILPTVADFATKQAGWISTNEMIDGLAFGESTPGPLVMVLTFIGFLAGAHRFGSISAGIWSLLLTVYYTFLPSFILILGGASLVEKTKESALLKTVFGYVTACVCAVILYLGIFFAKSILLKPETTMGLWIQNPLTQTNWLVLFWVLLSVLFLKFKKEYSIFWIFFSGLFFLGAESVFHL